MTKRVALLSIACGLAWHTMLVTLVFGRHISDALSWGLLPGAVAGLSAGAFTIWSRRRTGGRETLVDVIITYYLAVAVYILSGVPIVVASEFPRMHMGETFVSVVGAIFGGLYYGVSGATVLAIALLPLCYLTRQLVWRLRSDAAVEHSPAADDRPQAGGRV